MRINPVQQNQANFRGGMLFHEAKQVTTRAIDATPVITDLFLNSKNVLGMRSTENIEPFANKAGFKTFIDMVNGMTYAVKENFALCTGAWDMANHRDDGILDVSKL